MPTVHYSEISVRDFREIWEYIANDNERAADALVTEFERKLRMLATMPEMGKDESDLAEKLRSFPIGNYILFYREVSDGVQLIRALHGARDITSNYFGE